MALTISVITAVYNNRANIAGALDSILGQSYPYVETVVVDGASTDGTKELLLDYEERLSVLISEADEGIYDALNKGVRRARGDIVGFLHSDDIFGDKEVLNRIAAAFADPAVNAVYGDLVYVRREDPNKVVRYWRPGKFLRRKLVMGWMPPHPTLYFRRSFLESIGSFDARYKIAADYDYILRSFSRAEFVATYIPVVLVRMRVGGSSNKSLENIIRKSREDYCILRRSGVGGFWTLLCKNVRKLPQFFSFF